MQIIEGLTDAEIAEAHRSADVFAEVQEMTAPLDALLIPHSRTRWLDIRRNSEDAIVCKAFFDAQFGDPMEIALGVPRSIRAGATAHISQSFLDSQNADRRAALSELAGRLPWDLVRLGYRRPHGGFDAVIGNPPWDRLKLKRNRVVRCAGK